MVPGGMLHQSDGSVPSPSQGKELRLDAGRRIHAHV
jgi:hypothetical protein